MWFVIITTDLDTKQTALMVYLGKENNRTATDVTIFEIFLTSSEYIN